MQNLAKYTCVKSQVGGEDRDDQNLHTVRTFPVFPPTLLAEGGAA